MIAFTLLCRTASYNWLVATVLAGSNSLGFGVSVLLFSVNEQRETTIRERVYVSVRP